MIVAAPPGADLEILAALPGAEGRRIVWLELEAARERRRDGRPVIRGRGVNGYHWAVRYAYWRWQRAFHVSAYGHEPEQLGELRLPDGDGPFPVVVTIHGGYYREQWERDTAEPVAVDLARRGYATWNVEYRRVGPGGGGGWPTTFDDIAAAVDHVAELAREHPLDLGRVVVAGHSAGGHFALWAGSRTSFPDGVPGAHPKVDPVLVVSFAGVVDPELGAERGVGAGHNPISGLMGAMPRDEPARYAATSPPRLSVHTPTLLVQGENDDPDLIDMNLRYRAAHPEAEYLEVPGANHFDVVYPHSDAWATVVAAVERRIASPQPSEGWEKGRRGDFDI